MPQSNPAESNMNRPSESRSDSCDEPLFVLKYSRAKVIWRLIVIFAALVVCWSAVFHLTDPFWLQNLFLKVAGAVGLLYCSLKFIDILSFREVRLYNDRIVKVWEFIGKREIKLAEARLRCNAGKIISLGSYKEGPFNKYMTIFDRRTSVPFSGIKGVSYDEKLADPDDVKKLNTLLAGLTGRKIEDFEQLRIRIDRLIAQSNE